MIVRELINVIGFKVNQSQLRAAEKRVDGVVNKMRTAGQRMTMFFTLPFAGFVTAAVRAQGIQLQALAQVEKGIESTAMGAGRSIENLKAQAKSLQEETLFGDETILQNVSAQILTFTNIAEEQFDRTQKAVIDVSARVFGLNANAETLRSTSIQLGKALNDPVANLGALSRTGIQFSKSQKEVIKNLQETGRLAEAQELILAELEKQYGGSAKAAAEASVGFRQLWNDTSDLLEIWGQGLIPLVRGLTSWLRRVVVFLQEKMNPELRTAILIIGGLIAIIGPLLIGFSLMVVVGKAVAGMFLALKAAAWAANVPVAILLLKFILIAAAVAAVIVVITLLIEDFIIWRKGGESAIGAILESFSNLLVKMGLTKEMQKKLVKDWIEGWKNIGAGLHQFEKGIWIPFWERAGTMIHIFVKDWVEGWKAIGMAIEPAITKMIELWTTFWEAVGGKLFQFFKLTKSIIDKLKGELPTIPETVQVRQFTETIMPGQALPGLGGKSTVTNKNEFNVTVPVTVPEGTPEHQKRVISDYTEDVTEMLFRKYLGNELRQATQAGSIVE
jgi:hypothetical protein